MIGVGREHGDVWLLVTLQATLAIEFPYFLTCFYSVDDSAVEVEEQERIRWLLVFDTSLNTL